MYVLIVTNGRSPERVAWEPGKLARVRERPEAVAARHERARRQEVAARRITLRREQRADARRAGLRQP